MYIQSVTIFNTCLFFLIFKKKEKKNPPFYKKKSYLIGFLQFNHPREPTSEIDYFFRYCLKYVGFSFKRL